jgi:hypothetical protein
MRGTKPRVVFAFQGWLDFAFCGRVGVSGTAASGDAAAASAALARAAASAAWSLSRQHCLYLRPEPQWQGSLRPGRGVVGDITTSVLDALSRPPSRCAVLRRELIFQLVDIAGSTLRMSPAVVGLDRAHRERSSGCDFHSGASAREGSHARTARGMAVPFGLRHVVRNSRS